MRLREKNKPGQGRKTLYGEKAKTYTICLTESQQKKLRNIAKEKSMSVSELIRKAFEL